MDPKSITERLANLSPAKRALLEQRLKGKDLEALAGRTIPLRVSRIRPALLCPTAVVVPQPTRAGKSRL